VKVVAPRQHLSHDFEFRQLREIVAELKKRQDDTTGAFPGSFFFVSLFLFELPPCFCFGYIPMGALDKPLPVHLLDVHSQNKIRTNTVLNVCFDADTSPFQSRGQ
jgi:hypothetical protein